MDFRPELSWEFLSADEIAAKSLRALRNHVRHVKETSAYYRAALAHVEPEEIASLDDFGRLPLTARKNLAESSPQFLGVRPAQIAETVITAGTSGRPLPFVLTKSDLDRAVFSAALAMHGAGVADADRAALLVTLDRFSLDGTALYGGAVAAGTSCGWGRESPRMGWCSGISSFSNRPC